MLARRAPSERRLQLDAVVRDTAWSGTARGAAAGQWLPGWVVSICDSMFWGQLYTHARDLLLSNRRGFQGENIL